MPPFRAHVLLLLLHLLAASTSAASFACSKPSTCQSAVIGYIVPYPTTYKELISRFSHTTLHDIFAANQLLPEQAIPAETSLTIPFRCRCTGNGAGHSDLYTTQNKFDDGFVTHLQEIVTANHIADNAVGQNLWIPLPCSCDKVDGSDVTHFAYVVRNGDNTLEIGVKYGVPESTLLRINNITNHTSLRQGQILDIPLHGMVRGELSSMGTWSSVHYISGYRNRRLIVARLPTGSTGAAVKDAAHTAAETSSLHLSPEALKGVLVGLLVIIILSLVLFTFFYWRSACKSLSSSTNGVRQFNYNDLARATHKFSKGSMIGSGGFGEVYKATIKGQEVAVKKLKVHGKTKEFHRELRTISNTKHANLVRLVGWCGRIRFKDGTNCWKRVIPVELLLVFEWIPNGSLGEHLRNREQELSWDKRYKIVKGIGSALRYLHHECNPSILHRDIKPDNILLDNHFNAKLADFGLSMITHKSGKTKLAYAMGSEEYMDPKYMNSERSRFNLKLDVYSFGLVLLDIACTGKREEVRQMYGGSAQQVKVDSVVDQRLRVFDRMEVERVVVLGLKCSHPEETHRPSMEDAMKFLEDGVELPTTTEGEGGYSASCIVNEEAPMMPDGVVPSS